MKTRHSIIHFIMIFCLLTVGPLSASSDQFEEGRIQANSGNFSKALNLWKPLAVAGHPDANFSIGRMYARGDGVEKNFFKARDHFLQAILKKHSGAAYLLGQMSEYGDGTEKNTVDAIRWYSRADEWGHPGAKKKVAKLQQTLNTNHNVSGDLSPW